VSYASSLSLGLYLLLRAVLGLFPAAGDLLGWMIFYPPALLALEQTDTIMLKFGELYGLLDETRLPQQAVEGVHVADLEKWGSAATAVTVKTPRRAGTGSSTIVNSKPNSGRNIPGVSTNSKATSSKSVKGGRR
jgi:hypothetical protein